MLAGVRLPPRDDAGCKPDVAIAAEHRVAASCAKEWVAGRSGRDDWGVWFRVDTGTVRIAREGADPRE